MTRYTSGPWRVASERAGGIHAFDIVGPQGEDIGYCNPSDGADDPTLYPAADNARLCAAAPDLYEALMGLVNEMRGQLVIAEPEIRAAVGNTNMACVERRLTLATAALAKAEGRA